jgi:hypothetical protein
VETEALTIRESRPSSPAGAITPMDEKEVAKYPKPDLSIEHIAMLLDYELPAVVTAASSRS